MFMSFRQTSGGADGAGWAAPTPLASPFRGATLCESVAGGLEEGFFLAAVGLAADDETEEGQEQAHAQKCFGGAGEVAGGDEGLDRTGYQEHGDDSYHDLHRDSAFLAQLDAAAVPAGEEDGLGHQEAGAAADPDGG